MSPPKEQQQLTKTSKCLVDLWNRHHIPAGIIYLSPDGPKVIASQNILNCLNTILRNSGELGNAIEADFDVLRQLGDGEYFSLDDQGNPVRAFRGTEDPEPLPFPPDDMTQKQCWAYLRKEIEKEQIREE